MKTLWIDLLCFGSTLRAIKVIFGRRVKEIYYINTTRSFSRYISLLSKVVGKPVIQVTDIVESQTKLSGISLYELIQLRIMEISKKWTSDENVAHMIDDFCRIEGFNPVKFSEHLKERAYTFLYRPLQMGVYAEKICGKENALYLLRKTPLYKTVSDCLGKDKVLFYNKSVQSGKILNRQDYIYDAFLNPDYYSGALMPQAKLAAFYTCSIINNILLKISGRNKIRHDGGPEIGIELIRPRVRFDEINDVYWLFDSGISGNKVWGIESENYDKESAENLKKLGIKRCKVIRNPLRWFFSIKREYDGFGRYVVIGRSANLRADFKYMMRLILNITSWNGCGWLYYQEALYAHGVHLWESIYKDLGIRIIWSMHDVDAEKLIKAEAAERSGGFFIGTHWSNQPISGVLIQQRYDILFTWGPHFSRNIFTGYPYMGVFHTGYPLDYYFENKKERSAELRKRYAGKFILSYQDNSVTNDIIYGYEMQLQIHGMLVSLLNENEDLMILLKPKRKYYLDMVMKEMPELNRYINEGRIEVFLGNRPRTKVPPAQIGMASDLVIGLGISTAASESYFAGTVSFHADFTDFGRNEFSNKGLNKIVFRDIHSLEKAVRGVISDPRALTHSDYRKYYEMLDPFQDGKAYIRTGFIINRLQKALGEGLAREEALKKVKEEYDAFCSGFRKRPPVPQADLAKV